MMAKSKTTLRPGTEWDLYLERAENRWEEKFDPSGLAGQFIPYFRTGQRIKVLTRSGDGSQHERTGTVGVTTGWKPSFMLLHRGAWSSWDLLSDDDEVVAVQQGRNYVPIEENPTG